MMDGKTDKENDINSLGLPCLLNHVHLVNPV
jgi:hypothetical protein